MWWHDCGDITVNAYFSRNCAGLRGCAGISFLSYSSCFYGSDNQEAAFKDCIERKSAMVRGVQTDAYAINCSHANSPR